MLKGYVNTYLPLSSFSKVIVTFLSISFTAFPVSSISQKLEKNTASVKPITKNIASESGQKEKVEVYPQQNVTGRIGWTAKPASRENLSFIANTGQSDDAIDGLNGKEILYTITDNMMQVYFTKKGVYYKIYKHVKPTHDEWEEYQRKFKVKGEEEDQAKEIIKTAVVKMNWQGSDENNTELVGEEKRSSYHNFYRPDIDRTKIFGNVSEYKKILYKNVYPGIDVEYTIHPTIGIKYSIILHPGADPSVVKMNYEGADIHIDENGNVILHTELDNITDCAPLTYTGEVSEISNRVNSSFINNGNIIGFKIEGNNGPVVGTTIIDPWTKGSPLAGFSSCLPNDIAVDGSDNVIINGTTKAGAGANETQKYNSAGTLQWTLDMITNYGYKDNLQGDVQADNSNNIYISPGLITPFTTPYNTISINSNGTVLRWGNTSGTNSSNNMYEVWTLTFDCAKKNLYQSGGGLYIPPAAQPDLNVAASEPVNPANGNEGALYTTPAFGEIISSCYAPNGNIYQLVADSNKNGVAGYNIGVYGAYDYIIIVKPTTGAIIASSPTGYSASDGSNKNIYSVGYNGVGASCFYAYTTNGLFLDQRSLTTGALVKRINLPSGDSAQMTGHRSSRPGQLNSGIVFDSCGDVYVGTPGGIVEYDENLNFLGATTSGLSGTVFDMEMGNDQNIYATGGDSTGNSFVTQVKPPACSGLAVIFTGITCSALNSGTATANPQFAGPPFTYKWSNGETTQTATGLSAGTYTVVATGSPQCPTVYIESAVVIIPAIAGSNVTINVSAPTICSGSPTTLTESGGVGGTTYSWSSGGNGTSTTVSPVTTTTYTLTAITGTCTVTPTATVTVNTTPTITPVSASPSSICTGGSSTLTAGGASTYSWSPAIGVTTSTVTVSPGSSTTYTVTGTSAAGCPAASSATVAVTVNTTPTITPVSATPTAICPGGSSTLTAGGASAYSWSPAIGATTSTVTVSPGSTTTYTVTGTSAAGCPAASSATVAVTVNPTPTLTATAGSPTICSGGNTTLTGGGASTYTWTPSSSLTSSTGTIVTATPTATTTYTVNGTSAAGCPATSTQTVVVTVSSPPVLGAVASPATICSGTSTTLTGSNATTYTWTPSSSLTPSTGSIVTATPTTTTTYTLNGTASGCAPSPPQTVVVTVNTTPTVTAVASPTVICSGTPTTLTGSGATTYTWQPGALTGSTVSVSPGVSTTYTLTGTTNSCNSAPKTVAVTVNTTPTVTASAGSPTICSGNSTVLTGTGATTYLWQPGNITGSTVSVSPTTATTYTLVGTSNSCNSAAQTVTVNVNSIPTITVTPNSPSICTNGSVSLTANSTTGGMSYTWSPSASLSASTGSTVIATPVASTTYTVTGTASGCAGASVTDTVFVVSSLPVAVSPNPTTICAGDSVVLKATGATTFTWSPSTGLSCTSCVSIKASPADTTTYKIIGTNGSCKDSVNVTINVNPTPTVSVTITGISAAICPGDSMGMIASGATTYIWSPASSLSCLTCDTTMAKPGSTTTYTVTGSYATGCSATATQPIAVFPAPSLTLKTTSAIVCAGDSIKLIAGGVSSYSWSPPTGLNTTIGDTVIATPTAVTEYVVTGTGTGGCKIKDSVLLTPAPLPVITPGATSTSICTGGTGTTLTASGASTYIWQPGSLTGSTVSVNPSSSTTYTVTGTNVPSGCHDTASIAITVNTTPTVTISLFPAGNDTICSGQSITLNANGGAMSYLWSNGASTSTITVNPTVPIIYSVTASNGTCADSGVEQAINIYQPPVLTMQDDSSCAGKNTTISVKATGGNPGYTYSWNGTSGGSSITVTPLSNTVYTCVVTDKCNSTARDSATVYAFPPSSISFTPMPDTIQGGQYINFVNNTVGASSYYWTFGNEITSTAFNPYVQYMSSGSYIVTLIAINGGCRDTLSDTVYVEESIFVPNVFTPNGDGQNDVFHVTMTSMKEYYIEIFNRWGQKVFQANSSNIDWDGKSASGVKESDGDYLYIIKATDYSGKAYNLHGYIQLISN